MRPDVAADYQFGRRFIDHAKTILAHHLISEASAEEDMRHNTDLIVLRLDPLRVAFRARKDRYRSSYGGEFTIRSSRPSGSETELAKVIAGWGDYILYGFGRDDAAYMSAWMLGDLRVFRLWSSRETVRLSGKPPGSEQHNPDGTRFRAFKTADLPTEFVCASHPDALRRAA
jgi:hypothetical protein